MPNPNLTTLFALLASALMFSCAPVTQDDSATPFKVAVIGDTGYDAADTPEIDTGFERVLDLIKTEDAELLVILGDFSYEEEIDVADVYFANMDRVLGADFPILASDGNHDTWAHYEPYFKERMERMGLSGDSLAEDKYSVVYRDIKWVLLGEHGQPEFIEQQLAGDVHNWKVCGWHRVMNDMNAGGKGDEMGWDVYRECQDRGAIIATAHEHSYSRTMTMTELGNRAAGHGATGEPDEMEVGPGRTFVFVSGLGGRPTRDYHCGEHDDDTWWSTIYTSNYYLNNGEEVVKSCTEDDLAVEGYTNGALFITFNAEGDPRKADGYFKNVDGDVIDQFTITNVASERLASR